MLVCGLDKHKYSKILVILNFDVFNHQSVNFSPFSVIFYDNLQVLMIDYELITCND